MSENQMNSLRGMVLLAALLALAGAARAQDFRQSFVGKSPCAPGIQSEHSDFSLLLDKTQDLTLLYRDLSKVKILMIVQPTGDSNHCGVIRDLIQITRIAKDFEFRCFDPQAPTDVMIGTAIRNGSTKPLTAIDAWRIDLKEQKFIETPDKVTCSAEGWGGEDDGGDLADEVKKYAAHHKPGDSPGEQTVLPKGVQVTPLMQVTMEGKLIKGVHLKYPEEALRKRVGGTVKLHVILQKDGTVGQVDVVSGHPLFAQAAVDAVRQWKNQPMMLNGQAVERDTMMYVKFMLVPAPDTHP